MTATTRTAPRAAHCPSWCENAERFELCTFDSCENDGTPVRSHCTGSEGASGIEEDGRTPLVDMWMAQEERVMLDGSGFVRTDPFIVIDASSSAKLDVDAALDLAQKIQAMAGRLQAAMKEAGR